MHKYQLGEGMTGKRFLPISVAVLVLTWSGVVLYPQALRAQSSSYRMATADIERFVRQALEYCLASRNLPDIGLLGSSTQIAIREEIGAGLKLGRGALPQLEGYQFYLISEVAAQADADMTKQAIHFITISDLS